MDGQSLQGSDGNLLGGTLDEVPDEEEKVSPLRVAADVGLAGMDPLRFLFTGDPVERAVMGKIARYWWTRRMELDRNLATEIVKKLGESIKKGG